MTRLVGPMGLMLVASLVNPSANAADRDQRLTKHSGRIDEIRLEGTPASDNCLRDRILFRIGQIWFNVAMEDKTAPFFMKTLLNARREQLEVDVLYNADFSDREFVQRCNAFQADRKYYFVRSLSL